MNDTLHEFFDSLLCWCKKNYIKNVTHFKLAEDSSYHHNHYYTRGVVSIGVYEHPDINEWLLEFLGNLGLKNKSYPPLIYALLHELGHSETGCLLNDTERVQCRLLKFGADCSDKAGAFSYWNIEDELMANRWAVNLTNDDPECVEELVGIFDKYWGLLYDDLENLIGVE